MAESSEEEGVKLTIRLPLEERQALEGLRVLYGLKSEAQVIRFAALCLLSQTGLETIRPEVVEAAKKRVMKRKSFKLPDKPDM